MKRDGCTDLYRHDIRFKRRGNIIRIDYVIHSA